MSDRSIVELRVMDLPALKAEIAELHRQVDAVVAANAARESTVTRFEVIDQSGRVLTKYNVAIELSYQDDGRTLKVFMRQRQPGLPATRAGSSAP